MVDRVLFGGESVVGEEEKGELEGGSSKKFKG